MSAMFPTIQRLYQAGKLTEASLTNAVQKGWITEEEKQLIIAG